MRISLNSSNQVMTTLREVSIILVSYGRYVAQQTSSVTWLKLQSAAEFEDHCP